ncbi:MAG: YIP1 family protein [Terriglobales bacterium]
MATSSSTAPAAPTPRQMSSLTRLFAAFYAPGACFEDIAREPHFILCWCVQIVIGIAYIELMMRRVGVYTLSKQALMQSSRAAAMSPDQLQTAINTSAKFYHFSVYLVPVGLIAFLLVMGAIVLAISNFLLGQEGRYKQSLAVASHAYLPQTLMGLLTMLVLALMADPSNFNFVNPLGTNIGFYLDKSTTSAFLYNLAGHIGVFPIWIVTLLAVSIASLSGKKGKIGRAFWPIFALWLLFILCAAGLSAAFA